MSTVRLVHLSDPHFGTVLPEVEKSLVDAVHTAKPQLVLLSGDITQRARRSQFEAARRFKEKLRPLPTLAIPGNHDIPLYNVFGRLYAPYAGFHRHFQSKRETDILVEGVRVVGLNSTSRWRHVQGSLNLERIRGPLLADWKTANVRIVAVHHPLDCAKRVDDKNLLRGREAVFQLFESASIDLVLSGHVHDPFVTLSDARYPASKRSMILSVAGTCLSWRTRKGAPNSFNLIDIETGTTPRIFLTRMDIEGGTFRPKDVASFVRLPGGGWTRA